MTTRLLIGHVLEKLAEIPSNSVHMVWTSPPYWGLRSYGTEPQVWGGEAGCKHRWGDVVPRKGGAGRRGASSLMQSRAVTEAQIAANQTGRGNFCSRCGAFRGEHGLEPTLDLWLEHEVRIFREVRRVLRPDGTLWLNVGDAYATAPNGRSAADQKAAGTDDRTFRDKPVSTVGGKRVTAGQKRGDVDVGGWGASDDSLRWRSGEGLASKQRLMLPARLALALQADGWWLRDEIVWSKKNPMPSSVNDRTTPAHEMLYLLSKQPRYFFDDVAVLEPAVGANEHDLTGCGYSAPGQTPHRGNRGYKRPDGWDTGPGGHGSVQRDGREKGEPNAAPAQATRRKRSVWHMALEPFNGAHFATAPTGLVRPCILAGTSARGVCPACGAPWVRVSETNLVPTAKACRAGVIDERDHAADPSDQGANRQKDGHVPGMALSHKTLGWSPSCGCPEHKPVPAVVLDPFGGSGTTALVAEELGRDAVLIELNPAYARIARDRIREHLGRVQSDIPEEPPKPGLPLFEAAE